MKYVFEDDERDPLPQLLRKAYRKEWDSELVFTRGNGNLYSRAEELLNEGEKIVVYLDTIPGNDSTRRIYNRLRQLALKHRNKILVLPIIGAEYYFIKSIQYGNVVTDNEEVANCVNRKPYFESKLLTGEKEKEFCRNYEKYCKLILKKNVLDCVRNSEDSGANTHFRWYYIKNCKCSEPEQDCDDKTVKEKALDYVAAYPYMPLNMTEQCVSHTAEEELRKIHKKLVAEHNELCYALREAEPEENKKNSYKEIKPIEW